SWRALAHQKNGEGERNRLLTEAERVLIDFERRSNGASALYSLLGHKGDLMLVHFRSSFEELKGAELQLSSLGLWDFLEPADSFLSVVELGLYDSSVKTYQSLAERSIAPHTPEWDAAIKEVVERQREAMRDRLYPALPATRYLCFYPMDRKRDEHKNFYL